jgi:hypothetical protein
MLVSSYVFLFFVLNTINVFRNRRQPRNRNRLNGLLNFQRTQRLPTLGANVHDPCENGGATTRDFLR